jgi:hypothetical protein
MCGDKVLPPLVGLTSEWPSLKTQCQVRPQIDRLAVDQLENVRLQAVLDLCD